MFLSKLGSSAINRASKASAVRTLATGSEQLVRQVSNFRLSELMDYPAQYRMLEKNFPPSPYYKMSIPPFENLNASNGVETEHFFGCVHEKNDGGKSRFTFSISWKRPREEDEPPLVVQVSHLGDNLVHEDRGKVAAAMEQLITQNESEGFFEYLEENYEPSSDFMPISLTIGEVERHPPTQT